MNVWTFISCLVVSTTPLTFSACARKPTTDASQSLKESFQSTEPATRQAVEAATSQLKSTNYGAAAQSLAPLLNQPLNASQKQAISLALQEMNRAIEKNPALDTREMYELRRNMFRAVDGGSRF